MINVNFDYERGWGPMRTIGSVSVMSVALLLCQPAEAIHRGANDLPYGQAMTHPLDKPVNDKYDGKAFFMNLGPTGIRARIDPEHPTEFKVTFVFQDSKSPAKKLVEIGDHVIGANGKKFSAPHGFHRKQGGSRGWQGPPFELAHAIEDSQGKDGKLELMLKKGSGKGLQKKVTLQLKAVGRFSDTYPWNCPRSDKLLKNLCDFMISNGIKGRHHYQIQQMLALMAAGDKRVMPLVEAKAKSLMSRPVSYEATGMCTWGWGYSGIFLGEYYHMKKDKGVMRAVEALSEAYEIGMDYGSGGFSHRPYPYINQRASDTGVKGYGSMAGPGGLSMLAQSLFKANGLPYSEKAYQRTHQSYLQTAGIDNPRASIAYGFKGWEDVNIRISDSSTRCKSGKGNGYICPTGMDKIGSFKAEKWAKGSDGEWGMTLVASSSYPWLRSEAKDLLVYEYNLYCEPSVKQRRVIRPMISSEPSGAYSTQPGGGGHCAPMGMGAAAHFIGNQDNKSWGYLGGHLAAGCALSPGMLFDGHADATMHAFFSVLGASRATEKQFRSYLDYVKTLIVLSEPHDGQGLVEQPFGCQRNATCSIARDRSAYTHVMVMLLSIPKRKLLITGADYAQPAGKTTAKASSKGGASRVSSSSPAVHWSEYKAPAATPVKPARKARTVSTATAGALNRTLLHTIARLSDASALKAMAVPLSVVRIRVQVVGVDAAGALTVRDPATGKTASYQLSQLTPKDRATLAILVAESKPTNDAHALAAVFLECAGNVTSADARFEKAGTASRKKLEKLFKRG